MRVQTQKHKNKKCSFTYFFFWFSPKRQTLRGKKLMVSVSRYSDIMRYWYAACEQAIKGPVEPILCKKYTENRFFSKNFSKIFYFCLRWTVVKSEASVREPLVLRVSGHVSRSQRQILTNERVWWGVGRRPTRRHAPRAHGEKTQK